MSWERLMSGSEGSPGWWGRAEGQVCPPGTWGTHGAGELWVPLPQAVFPKASNLHCSWRSALALTSALKLCGVVPQVQANPQGAQLLSGGCPEPNTTPQWLGWPQHCPDSGEIWGHGAADPGQHAACTRLHPAANRDWCDPGTVPRSLAWCCAPQLADAADLGQGLSHLVGQSWGAAWGCAPCPASSHHRNSH